MLKYFIPFQMFFLTMPSIVFFVKIFFKNLVGKTIPLDVHPAMTVFAVKNAIFDKEGIPASSQRLLYGGTDLLDAESLEGCSIGDFSNLDVKLRIVGGGPMAAVIVAVGGTAMAAVGTAVGGPAVGAVMIEKTAEGTVVAAAVPSA